MKGEEILLQAIGMLPDEMIAQEETEELREGALKIEKEEKRRGFLHKAKCVLAAAACFIVVITSINVWKNYNTGKPGAIGNDEAKVILSDENNYGQVYSNEDKDINEKSGINFFVMADTGSKKNTGTCQDASNGKSGNEYAEDMAWDLKKVLQGRTVKLQTVTEAKNNSASKKVKKTKYIVFGMDEDFYFTISKDTGNTYVQDKEGNRKHFVTGKEALCKAGGKVYFDISGMEGSRNSYGSVPAWDKKGIEIITSTEIYKQKDGSREKAGIFYIGVKVIDSTEKNRERNVYYGIFENKKED